MDLVCIKPYFVGKALSGPQHFQGALGLEAPHPAQNTPPTQTPEIDANIHGRKECWSRVHFLAGETHLCRKRHKESITDLEETPEPVT